MALAAKTAVYSCPDSPLLPVRSRRCEPAEAIAGIHERFVVPAQQCSIPTLSSVMTDAPRWLLLATLVSAPLLYGSTREWTTHNLIGQLLVIAALWIAGSCVTRRRPDVKPLLLVIGSYLIFHAWWMALNAKYVCDPDTVQFTPVSAFLPAGPGSIDRRLSIETAMLVTGLVCASWMGSDMAAVSIWRRRLLFAMAATGVMIACLGALQRLSGATAIYWSGETMGQSFFGTFRNHDNAAAFINLTWPLAGGLLVGALSGGQLWKRILWGAGMVVGLAGALVSGSRTGALIACALLIGLGAWCFWQTAAGRMGSIRVPELVAAAVLLLILMGAFAVFTGVDFSLQRWANLGGELTGKNYRYNAYQVCLKMVPEAGWFGFGPGTFQCAFPYFTHELGDAIKGRWIHAHEDYLQTFVEWGYTGGVAWTLFVGGAVLVSCVAFAKNRRSLSFNRRAQFAAMLLVISGVLIHALVDFPLQIPSIQLYAGVLLGLLWNAPRWMAGLQHDPSQSQRESS